MMDEQRTAPSISVLVCTRNRAESIGKCVTAILANPVEEMELVVVDQSDDDGTTKAMAELDDPRLRYLRTATRGLSRARNVGIEASLGAIVLFTDDDCYVEPSWVSRFLAEFERDPDLDAVYGRVLPFGEGGEDMQCPTTMQSTEPRLVEGLKRERMQEAVGHGNSMAFRRDCFVRHGLFHEWLGAGTPMTGGEDTDFSFRILRSGARIYYSPKPVAYHDNWMPHEAANRQLYGYMVSGSAVFTRFALRGSFAALMLQLRYFRGYFKDIRWWKKKRYTDGVRHVRKLVRRHLVGIFWGVVYATRSAPAYTPGQRTHEWTEIAHQREAVLR